MNKKQRHYKSSGTRSRIRKSYSRRKRQVYIYRAILGGVLCLILILGITAVRAFFRNDSEVSASSGETSETSPTSLTEETSAPVEPVSITVSFTGDCTLGTDVNFDYNSSLNAYYESNGPDYFLQNVRSYFEADDLTIVNFEGTLTTSIDRTENLFSFKGDPEFTSILTGSSVEAANMANNHSHDYGEQGLDDTISNLQNAGITTFGYDDTAVMDIKGIKVGLVGIYELYDHLERTQQLKDNIAKVKANGAQLIIVIFHWGNEKETTPDNNQITLGHLAIDEGAHVVVGHHSHVIQPMEQYNGRYIAYSMANFCFGGNSAPSDTDTFIFQQTFTITGDEVAADNNINLIPCYITSAKGYNNYQPTPAEGDEAQRILNRIQAPIF